MFTFNKNTYESVLKILAVLSSIALMFISAQFSVDGFSFQSPNKVIIGWVLAVILIIVEMIFNNSPPSTKSDDLIEARRAGILFLAGLVAYAYGIATNVSGILHSGRMPDSWFDYIVPVALGLFIEIVPEPLMVWALLTPSKKYQQQRQPQYKSAYPNPPKANISRFSESDVYSKLPKRH